MQLKQPITNQQNVGKWTKAKRNEINIKKSLTLEHKHAVHK